MVAIMRIECVGLSSQSYIYTAAVVIIDSCSETLCSLITTVFKAAEMVSRVLNCVSPVGSEDIVLIVSIIGTTLKKYCVTSTAAFLNVVEMWRRSI